MPLSPERPLTVSLSALTMVDGGMGGTETYLRGLLEGFDHLPGLSVWLHSPKNVRIDTSGADVLHGPKTGQALASRAATATRLMADRRLLRGKEDVVHYPFTVPLPRSTAPHVVTLHDVQHLAIPGNFSSLELAYRRLAYDTAAVRADAVVTDSHFSKLEIVRLLGIPHERVHAVHLGVAADATPRRLPREDFVLYPARRWPHKNHARLIDAIQLVRRTRPSLRLVLTGGGAPLPSVPYWVEQAGLVPRAELLDLYRRAACLVFPSLYEGFGLPPLEAMASGCPVAVSRGGSLEEVCGVTAEVFDPTDVRSIAAGIERAILMPEARVSAGVDRAARFTWRRSAERHLAVYRRVRDARAG